MLGGAPRAIGFTCGYGFFYVWPLNQDNIKNELGSAPNPSTKTHTAKGSTTPKESAVESRPPHFSAENFRVQPSNPSCPHLRLLNRVKGTSLRTECTHPVASECDGWCFSRVASNNHDAGFRSKIKNEGPIMFPASVVF